MLSHLDQTRQRLDVIEQLEHFPRLVAIVQEGDDFDRLRYPLQISLQLRLEGLVEHGVLDLADQIQRGLQGAVAGGPFGRAHFARMRGDVLRGPHLAQ